MNLLQRNKARSRQAFTLIECIVYMAVFTLLLGAAIMAFYRCFDHMQSVRRNSDDIGRALRVGEIWREDIRGATNAIQLDDADQTLRISRADGEVSYRFENSQVLRKAKADSSWAVLLPRVQASRMQSDPRTHVTPWRWDLELQAKNPKAHIKPLFTFLAVPSTSLRP